MSLPKLNAPSYEMEIPSTGEKVKYRPFLVKEQKMLMIAQESNDPNMMANCICDLIESCCEGVKEAEKMPTFDLEYMFLQLRAVSVGGDVELEMLCKDDGETKVPVVIKLDELKVKSLPNHKKEVMITDKIGMTFRYPSLVDVAKYTKEGVSNVDVTFGIIQDCLVNIYDENEVYDQHNQQELKEFIEQMTTEQFEEIQSFFDTMPKVRHTVEVNNPNTGVVNKVHLEGMQSFLG
jgi:predicted transcriptional regulator